MKTQQIVLFAAVSLTSLEVLLGSTHPALANDCQAMMQDFIQYSKIGGSGFRATVAATVSSHSINPSYKDAGFHSDDITMTTAGLVEYANGALDYSSDDSIQGIVPLRWNTSTWSPIPPGTRTPLSSSPANSSGSIFPPQTIINVPPPKQPFAPTPQLTYRVQITRTGVVTIATLINNKNFLGRAPVTFQGICSKGVITGSANGDKFHTITLRRATRPVIR
jgi:hypothetical protein